MKEKVTVIGIGRLGLSFALLLDSKGYDVCGCDVNEPYIESLKNKTFNSDEPQINELLSNSKMYFTTNYAEAFNHSPIIFIFVPTPSKEGGEYDHKYIEQVVDEIEKQKVIFKTIIISCTVMPGYCESIKQRLSILHIRIVYNPFFIAQGSILDNLKNSDIVLLGGDNKRIPSFMHDIHKGIIDKEPNFKYLSLTGAEIAKMAINCFLTMKIAYGNMIGEIAINSKELGVGDILQVIGSDSRIGNKYLTYGFPAGGVCFPRDQKALGVHANKVGINTTFTSDIDTENKRHSKYLKEYWMKYNPNKDVPFLFTYLGYKEGVYILTESYQFKLCMDLLNEGYNVIILQDTSKMDMPIEFKAYCDSGNVTFETVRDKVQIN